MCSLPESKSFLIKQASLYFTLKEIPALTLDWFIEIVHAWQ